MRAEHPPASVALPRVVMHYCHAGIIQRPRHTVDSADEVGVLAVHEVAIVKEQKECVHRYATQVQARNVHATEHCYILINHDPATDKPYKIETVFLGGFGANFY